jgi:hypothetical protein
MSYQLIKDFIGLTDCVQGSSLKELLQVESKLGRYLPKSLRKYYQCFGKNSLLANAFHELIPASQLNVLNGYLIFYVENQKVWIAGIPVDAFPVNEPSVWLTYDEGQNWEKFCDSLSEFLTSMSLFQILEKWPYIAIKEGVENSVMQRIILNWQELIGTCAQTNTQFFSNQVKTQLIGVTQESYTTIGNYTYYIRIATSTIEDYEQVVGKIGVKEWDYSSLSD